MKDCPSCNAFIFNGIHHRCLPIYYGFDKHSGGNIDDEDDWTEVRGIDHEDAAQDFYRAINTIWLVDIFPLGISILSLTYRSYGLVNDIPSALLTTAGFAVPTSCGKIWPNQ